MPLSRASQDSLGSPASGSLATASENAGTGSVLQLRMEASSSFVVT